MAPKPGSLPPLSTLLLSPSRVPPNTPASSPVCSRPRPSAPSRRRPLGSHLRFLQVSTALPLFDKPSWLLPCPADPGAQRTSEPRGTASGLTGGPGRRDCACGLAGLLRCASVSGPQGVYSWRPLPGPCRGNPGALKAAVEMRRAPRGRRDSCACQSSGWGVSAGEGR